MDHKPDTAADTALAVEGLWTPWSAILCIPCHGPAFRGRDREMDPAELARRSAPRHKDGEAEDLTTCDRCGCDVWARADVAALNNLRYLIGEASWEDDTWGGGAMEQTGGMCAALRIDMPGDRVAIVTDGGMSDAEGAFVACFYSRNAWAEGEEPDDRRAYEDPDFTYPTAEAVVAMLREAARTPSDPREVVALLQGLVPAGVTVAWEFPGFIAIYPGDGRVFACGDGGAEWGWDLQIQTAEGEPVTGGDTAGPSRFEPASVVAEGLAALFRAHR